MPAMMKCPFCEFDGAHGFNSPGVGGIMHFYHPKMDGSQCDGSWTVDGQSFPDKKKAWEVAKGLLKREANCSDTWLAAWDARIIEHNEAKAKRLFSAWENEFSVVRYGS